MAASEGMEWLLTDDATPSSSLSPSPPRHQQTVEGATLPLLSFTGQPMMRETTPTDGERHIHTGVTPPATRLSTLSADTSSSSWGGTSTDEGDEVKEVMIAGEGGDVRSEKKKTKEKRGEENNSTTICLEQQHQKVGNFSPLTSASKKKGRRKYNPWEYDDDDGNSPPEKKKEEEEEHNTKIATGKEEAAVVQQKKEKVVTSSPPLSTSTLPSAVVIAENAPQKKSCPPFVLLMRHGERADDMARHQDNISNGKGGSFNPADPPLSEHGKREAHTLGAVLSQQEKELFQEQKVGQHKWRREISTTRKSIPSNIQIVSSPFTRTLQTAQALVGGMLQQEMDNEQQGECTSMTDGTPPLCPTTSSFSSSFVSSPSMRVGISIDADLCEVYGPQQLKVNHPPREIIDRVVAASTTSQKVQNNNSILPPWGEQLPAARQRFLRCYLKYLNLSRQENKSYILVTHGDAIETVFSYYYSHQMLYEVGYLGFLWVVPGSPRTAVGISVEGKSTSIQHQQLTIHQQQQGEQKHHQAQTSLLNTFRLSWIPAEGEGVTPQGPLTVDPTLVEWNLEEEQRKIEQKLEQRRVQAEEVERRAKMEVDRKAKEEAERGAREEADRKVREQAERQAREEAERQAREEAERQKRKEEAERQKAQEETDRIAREEYAERKKNTEKVEEAENTDRRRKEKKDNCSTPISFRILQEQIKKGRNHMTYHRANHYSSPSQQHPFEAASSSSSSLLSMQSHSEDEEDEAGGDENFEERNAAEEMKFLQEIPSEICREILPPKSQVAVDRVAKKPRGQIEVVVKDDERQRRKNNERKREAEAEFRQGETKENEGREGTSKVPSSSTFVRLSLPPQFFQQQQQPSNTKNNQEDKKKEKDVEISDEISSSSSLFTSSDKDISLSDVNNEMEDESCTVEEEGEKFFSWLKKVALSDQGGVKRRQDDTDEDQDAVKRWLRENVNKKDDLFLLAQNRKNQKKEEEGSVKNDSAAKKKNKELLKTRKQKQSNNKNGRRLETDSDSDEDEDLTEHINALSPEKCRTQLREAKHNLKFLKQSWKDLHRDDISHDELLRVENFYEERISDLEHQLRSQKHLLKVFERLDKNRMVMNHPELQTLNPLHPQQQHQTETNSFQLLSEGKENKTLRRGGAGATQPSKQKKHSINNHTLVEEDLNDRKTTSILSTTMTASTSNSQEQQTEDSPVRYRYVNPSLTRGVQLQTEENEDYPSLRRLHEQEYSSFKENERLLEESQRRQKKIVAADKKVKGSNSSSSLKLVNSKSLSSLSPVGGGNTQQEEDSENEAEWSSSVALQTDEEILKSKILSERNSISPPSASSPSPSPLETTAATRKEKSKKKDTKESSCGPDERETEKIEQRKVQEEDEAEKMRNIEKETQKLCDEKIIQLVEIVRYGIQNYQRQQQIMHWNKKLKRGTEKHRHGRKGISKKKNVAAIHSSTPSSISMEKNFKKKYHHDVNDVSNTISNNNVSHTQLLLNQIEENLLLNPSAPTLQHCGIHHPATVCCSTAKTNTRGEDKEGGPISTAPQRIDELRDSIEMLLHEVSLLPSPSLPSSTAQGKKRTFSCQHHQLKPEREEEAKVSAMNQSLLEEARDPQDWIPEPTPRPILVVPELTSPGGGSTSPIPYDAVEEETQERRPEIKKSNHNKKSDEENDDEVCLNCQVLLLQQILLREERDRAVVMQCWSDGYLEIMKQLLKASMAFDKLLSLKRGSSSRREKEIQVNLLEFGKEEKEEEEARIRNDVALPKNATHTMTDESKEEEVQKKRTSGQKIFSDAASLLSQRQEEEISLLEEALTSPPPVPMPLLVPPVASNNNNLPSLSSSSQKVSSPRTSPSPSPVEQNNLLSSKNREGKKRMKNKIATQGGDGNGTSPTAGGLPCDKQQQSCHSSRSNSQRSKEKPRRGSSSPPTATTKAANNLLLEVVEGPHQDEKKLQVMKKIEGTTAAAKKTVSSVSKKTGSATTTTATKSGEGVVNTETENKLLILEKTQKELDDLKKLWVRAQKAFKDAFQLLQIENRELKERLTQKNSTK